MKTPFNLQRFSLVLISLLNLLAINGWAQSDNRNIGTKFDVSAFIKGHLNAVYIDHSQIKNGFDLELSDPSYKVESFRMGWFDTIRGNVHAWIRGSHVTGTGIDYNLKNAYAEGIYQDAGGKHMLAFDEILVRKNEELFYLPAFIVLLGNTGKVDQYYSTYAKNQTFIEGQKGRFVVPDSVFNENISLKLVDSTFKILGFTISFNDQDGLIKRQFYFKGDSIDMNDHEYQETINQLDKKYSVNIVADVEKDGIRKLMPALSLEAWDFDYINRATFSLHYTLGMLSY